MQFDDQFSGNIDLAWGLVGCGLVVEGGGEEIISSALFIPLDSIPNFFPL